MKNFPFIVYEKGLLNYSIFNERITNLWNIFVSSFEDRSTTFTNISFVKWDIKYVEQKEIFRELFEDDSFGTDVFISTWNLFNNWWYIQPIGAQYILNKYSDDLIPIVYHKTRILLSDSKVNVSLNNYSIQFVYDALPENCLIQSKFFFIQPITSNLDSQVTDQISMKMAQYLGMNQ